MFGPVGMIVVGGRVDAVNPGVAPGPGIVGCVDNVVVGGAKVVPSGGVGKTGCVQVTIGWFA